MDKRYQVFVSSTFTDLKEERHSIMLTLMKMDCIPAGMEHFPAADEEQWNFIKRIIDYSDYYLLIIGGRYGSLDDDGLSFTEKEYDYAVSKNIKVIALIHENPDKLSYKNSEQDPDLRRKLDTFRDKVKTKRLVDFWSEPAELPGKVALGIMNAKTMYPAIGWVRADRISNEQTLSELIKAKNEIEILKETIENSNKEVVGIEIDNTVADFSDTVELHYELISEEDFDVHSNQTTEVYIYKIFNCIAATIIDGDNDSTVAYALSEMIIKELGTVGYRASITLDDLITLKVHFLALQLITVDRTWWSLTEKGYAKMMELRIIRKK